MISKRIVLTLALCGLAAPEAAFSRDFLAYQSTTPILYRYAACALAQDKPTAKEQLASCENLRQSLEQDAKAILPRFHSGDRRKAQLNLRRGFQEIDRDAVLSRKQRKTVPSSIISYLKCMGESVMRTEDYQRGIAVDYIGIEEPCVTDHVLSVTSVSSEQEIERIQILYTRFARSGRYVDNAVRLGSGIASTGDRASVRLPNRRLAKTLSQQPFFVVMENSFLDLSQLPADEEQDG